MRRRGPRSTTPFEGSAKRRAVRRRAGRKSGWTPSAHPRPWNPTRATVVYRSLSMSTGDCRGPA
jgi:hypothetical protein